jgi:transcriptional regulator GlxA family with amidase domain
MYRVGILIFDGVEVLDFCGPFEVFSIARLDEAQRQQTGSPFEVKLVAPSLDVVTATGGLRVLPDYALSDCPALEVLVVPGGAGVRREIDNAALLKWIATRAANTPVVASVCTGALLLARAGLLDGLPVTTHWALLDWLRAECPAAQVDAERRVIDTGHIVTSAGVSAGIDMALSLVSRYSGEDVAAATARRMEYVG